MSRGSSRLRWPLLVVATLLVAISTCSVDAAVADPLAQFRVAKLHGRVYVGPGVCGITLDCGAGYIDEVASVMATPGSPRVPVPFTNDTSLTCTDTYPPNLKANYTCSLAANNATCAGNGKTCRCNDLCAAGPLCNWRRSQYSFPATHIVFNGTHNVRQSLGIKSGSCSSLTDTYRQTTPDYNNHVLLAQKSGFELTYAPEPCSQFGPRGCAQFNTRWYEYRCFTAGLSSILKGGTDISLAQTETEILLPPIPELEYQPALQYWYITGMPRISRDLPAIQTCIPRGTGGLLGQNWRGCLLHGCDNGATCDPTYRCTNCPLNYTNPGVFCRTDPCQNGGILSVRTERKYSWSSPDDVVTFPVCTCPPEWTGYGCELKNTCLNGGTIYPTATWEIGSTSRLPMNGCICAGKFFGDKCQNVCPIRMGVKPCYPITTSCPAACSQNIGCANGGCSGRGTCNEATGVCTACKPGWHGQYCEISCAEAYHPTQCPGYDLNEYIDERNNIKYPGGIPVVTLTAELIPHINPNAIPHIGSRNYVIPPLWNDPSKIPTINCTRLDPNAIQVGNKCVCSDPCIDGLACNMPRTLMVDVMRFPVKSRFMLGGQWTSNDEQLRKETVFNGTHFKSFACWLPSHVEMYSQIRIENGLPAMIPISEILSLSSPRHNRCYQYGSAGCGKGFKCQTSTKYERINVTLPFTNTTQLMIVGLDGVCCRNGYIGERCQTFTGCVGTPCQNGGRCLTTLLGKALPPAETRCFGCDAGFNGTTGWTGTFCEIPLDPTYTTVKVSTLPSASRRLLQSGEDAYISVRSSFVRSSDKGGKLYREPARACDCNVQWQPGVVENLTSANPGKPIVKFGNYASWSHSADAVMLSPMRFEANSPIQPVWRRKVSSHAEAQYQTSVDFGFGGYYAEDPDVNGNFYVSYWYDNSRPRVLEGLTRTAPYSAHYVYTNMLGRAGTVRLTRYDLNRAPDRSKCASMTFDPVFYYGKYSQQCESVRAMGGIGNLRLPNNTVIATETLAYLHFHFFGHRVRNQPNANCDLTGDWAEDETGCVNKLRYPKVFYPLAANETLTAAICGNVSRIEPERVAFGKALKPGATGTNVTDDGQDMCKCFPPFRAADEIAQVDCSFDMCGMVDKRGLVNASHAGYFTQKATPEACVCQGIWGTDPETCIGNKCEWCAATVCHNGGTANGSDYQAGCQCAPIFNGTYCQNNLCNATNSFPHNASLWEDRILEQIVCDCHPGWTGTLCNDKQCVHGRFNRSTEKCDCFEGWNAGAQGICDDSKCIPSHGLWNNNTHSCDCEHPWRGDSCEIDTCDDYNSVLAIPGWDGMRPFGQSVISQVDGLWTCKCNWPYMALNRTNDGEFDDRSWDCKANDCGHGIPTPNRNWLNRTTTKKTLVNGVMADKVVPVDPLPSEACTCRDPYGIGILTDPTRCVGLSHAECPNACLQATCQLTAEKIELIGGYVPVASSDPSCCMCPASAMFQSNGTCQHFCRFYQPCLTTEKSSFMRNPNYTSDPFAYDDIEREYDPDNQEYVCKCNAYYSNTTPDMNDCSNYTFLATDPHWNTTDNTPFNPQDGGNSDTISNGSGGGGGGGGLSATEQALAIGLSVGAVVMVGIVQALQAWFKSTQVVAEAGKKIVSSVVEGTLDGVKSSLGPKTVSSSGNSVQMTSLGVLGMLYIVVLLSFISFAEAAGSVRAWPETLMWNKPSTTRCHSDVPSEVSFYSPVDALDAPHTYMSFAGQFSHDFPVGDNVFYGQMVPYPSSYIRNPSMHKDYQWTVDLRDQTKHATFGENTHVPVSHVTHSSFSNAFVSGSPAHEWFGLNICDRRVAGCPPATSYCPPADQGTNVGDRPDRRCVNGGSCTSIDAFASARGGGFPACKDEYDAPVRVANGIKVYDHYQRFVVRGCVCSAGFYGLYCEKTCPSGLNVLSDPDTHMLCSGHGICDSNTVETTDGVYTCACKGGCRCRQGYEGKYCEKAVQTTAGSYFTDRPVGDSKFEYINLMDITECCPSGSTACSTRATHSSISPAAFYRPTIPCKGGGGVRTCGASNELTTTPQLEITELDSKLSQHLSANEDFERTGHDPCGQFATLHGYEGVANNGRGQCWAGVGSTPSKPFCWCNPFQTEYALKEMEYASGVGYAVKTNGVRMVPRRGFWGAGCKKRTCTERKDPYVHVPDRLGNPFRLEVKAPLVNGYPRQCSGHASGQINGNSTKYDDPLQPCDDTSSRGWNGFTNQWDYYNVNTDGRCRSCDHGWGLVPGYHILALKSTAYPGYTTLDSYNSYGLAPGGDQGVCAAKTFHTIGGNACGGYYSALIDARNNTLPGPTGSKQVQYVGGCDCGPKEWGLIVPPNNGGICQRTCAGNASVAVIPIEFFDATGAFIGNSDYNTRTAPEPPRCGGYTQGICRPISKHGYDGWNSACLCNAGYNGPDCVKDESMWKNGTVCGNDAEPYMPERPAGATKYSNFMDEDFFHRSIVPLQREGLLSKTAYSGHKCRCKDYAVAAGWEMDGNFCGPSCDTLRSSKFGNLICSGATQGTCISSPYPGAVGKVCRCAKGWAGEKCDIPILTDKLGRQCGGSDRGKIVFKDAFNMTQRCDCVAPFVPNSIAGQMNGTCWADCPVNPLTKQKCTGEDQGACTLDLVADGLNGMGTGNDNICKCTAGAYEGKDCSIRLVAVYTTQNGRVMPCTGHGLPDPDRNGFCRCDPGWIGFACEIYSPNRQCGTGQTFLDHEALGYNVL